MSTVDSAKYIFEKYLEKQRQDFGELLTQKRLRRGLSVIEMGKKIGVHHSQISRWENGETVPLYLPTVMAVAECYRLNNEEKNKWYQLVFGFFEPSYQAFIALENLEEVFQLNPDIIDDISKGEGSEQDGWNNQLSRVIYPLLRLIAYWIGRKHGEDTKKLIYVFKVYAQDDECDTTINIAPLLGVPLFVETDSKDIDVPKQLSNSDNNELRSLFSVSGTVGEMPSKATLVGNTLHVSHHIKKTIEKLVHLNR